MQKIFSLIFVMILLLIPNVLAGATILDTIDLTACDVSAREFDIHTTENYIYVAQDNYIGIIDFSDVTNLQIEECVSTGLNNAVMLDFIESSPNKVAISTGDDPSILIFNETDNGADLDLWLSVAQQGSYAFAQVRDSLGGDLLLTRHPVGSGLQTWTYTMDTATLTSTDSISNQIDPYSMSKYKAPSGFGGDIYHVISTNSLKLLVKNGNMVQNQSDSQTNIGKDHIKYFGNVYASQGDNVYLYEFIQANDSINTRASISRPDGTSTGLASGISFISESIILIAYAHPDNSSNTIIMQYNITDLNNPIQTANYTIEGIVGSDNNGDMEYEPPYIFLMSGAELMSIEFIPDEYNTTNNKKPSISDQQLSRNAVSLNQNTVVSYTVNNPETNEIDEQILTTFNCNYQEETLKEEDFTDYNFSGVSCNAYNIGTRNNINFDNGLNVNTCTGEFLAYTGAIQNETIVSFDVYTPFNISAYANIDIVDYGANTIQYLNISISQGGNMTISQGYNGSTPIILLENIVMSTGTENIPTRIFLQISPNTANSNNNRKIFVSTNYFSQTTAANIDKTYCDTEEYCYISDTFLPTNSYTTFYGFYLDNATSNGTFVIDNFKIKQTSYYDEYDISTDENIAGVCNYSSVGDRTIRIYASDNVFKHNYLSYKDLSVSVTTTGIPSNVSIIGGIGGIGNSSTLGETITGLVAVAFGDDTESLMILGLLLMIFTAIVIGWVMIKDSSFGAVTGTISGVWFIETILLYTMGWFPLLALLLVILLAAAIFGFVFMKAMTGGGG